MTMPILQTASAGALHELLFVAVPYAVIVLFFAMTLKRFVSDKFSYSTYSSQFLENRQHFYGSVPWHFGILALLAGHLAAFLIPKTVLWWNSIPLRLWITELAGLIFAFVTLMGLINLMIRRARDPRVRAVTTKLDVLILVMLLVQVLSGMYIAMFYRWGSNWFAAVLSPYLKSIFTLSPDASGVVDLPWMIKAHVLGAYAIFAVFPFTRLVHVLVVPNPYLWRRPQVVLWNRNRKVQKQGRA